MESARTERVGAVLKRDSQRSISHQDTERKALVNGKEKGIEHAFLNDGPAMLRLDHQTLESNQNVDTEPSS